MTIRFSVDQGPIICIHEDRPNNLIGLKLAVLSVMRHSPELSVLISCPYPPESLCQWVESFGQVQLASFPELGKLGWNIKPVLLLHLLEAGASEIIWLDSDIIVNGGILSTLICCNPDRLVATEETYWGQKNGGTLRTVAWGLTPGRELPSTINTGLVRVTRHHIPLIKAWKLLCSHPSFVHVQGLPWYERPLHMVGDQDLLTALVGSTEFSDLDILLLKRGMDIAQCFGPAGFTPIERIKRLSVGLPPLIHAMGPKPWNKPLPSPAIRDPEKPLLKSLRDYYSYLSLEVSPYVPMARQYREELEDETHWMELTSPLGKLMATVMGHDPILQGLPLSVFDALARRLRRYLNIARYSLNSDLHLKESPLKQVSSDG